MHARKGDWLVVEGTHVGDGRQEGLIIDIPHPDGSPPYLVKWLDGREGLVFPGPDGRVIDHAPHEHVAS
ncbi:DUF1918 domain-containing protein [Gandjariella thermophila]|uniref:DUF1918 domain-containing protein n=1 Tax=Gandjariella thermophila TaxID=1931992 RepID=A0A4D4JDV3_9PSEU|nr:DUF1918 domain-containing protein [Gandjariella thermophila]GDY33804.1 hypothetical protein GTS_54370 [Gandjariella thermophila]